jgi:hypothetical protein
MVLIIVSNKIGQPSPPPTSILYIEAMTEWNVTFLQI